MNKKSFKIVTEEYAYSGNYDVYIQQGGNRVKVAEDIDEKTYNILVYYLRQAFDALNRKTETV